MGVEYIHYTDDEAHIVRRLGAAFVSLWPNLPEDVREQVVEKSLKVNDSYQGGAQLDQDIRDFIAKHAGEM